MAGRFPPQWQPGGFCITDYPQERGKGAGRRAGDYDDCGRLEGGPVGGFKSGLFFWESCCLLFLLYNMGIWVYMSTEAVKKGEPLQSWYLRLLLRQGLGVPSSSMMFESGTLSVVTNRTTPSSFPNSGCSLYCCWITCIN